MDATSLPEPPTAFAEIVRNAGDRLDGVKIGLPKEYLETEGLAPTVRSAFETAVDTLRAAGAEIVPVSLPRSKYAIAAYYVIATAEAGANLARFDGVRYGARVENSDNLTDLYFQTRGRGFGAEVKRRILLGTFVLSSGYYDAYYLRAQKVRTLVRQDFEDAFKRCDVILSPVSPTPAFRLGEISDPVQMYLADIFTISANLAGICGACVPATLADGLPVGVQFLGPVLGENAMFKAARVFETRRACQNFVPPL